MPAKLKLYLLDAVIVIELHRLGLWTQVTSKAEVILPSIVAERESQYWVADDEALHPIDLADDIALGRIRVESADGTAMKETLERFDPVMPQSIDMGELEALTILRQWNESPSPSFCTADYKAIEAACLLGLDQQCISLQEALERIGVSKALAPQFRKATMRSVLKRALVARIQGRGIGGLGERR